MKKETDYTNIIRELSLNNRMSTLDAVRKCGTTKLPTRIGEIEKKHNIRFKRVWSTSYTSHKKFYVYSLSQKDLKMLMKIYGL